MAKTISIGSKTITVTQLVVAIVLAVGALGGGFWSILKAEDRWNQKANCYENALKTEKLKENTLAGFKQMYYQQDVKFEEQRLTDLYDDLVEAEAALAADPNNGAKQQKVNYLREEIKKTKSKLQKLHDERVQ